MATRRHTKKHASKKASTKKHTSSSSNNGKTMKAKCIGCRGKEVMIHDVKEVEYKLHGKTRKRLEGKCENGHKFFRFIKA
jgi:hypothetical protein